MMNRMISSFGNIQMGSYRRIQSPSDDIGCEVEQKRRVPLLDRFDSNVNEDLFCLLFRGICGWFGVRRAFFNLINLNPTKYLRTRVCMLNRLICANLSIGFGASGDFSQSMKLTPLNLQ